MYKNPLPITYLGDAGVSLDVTHALFPESHADSFALPRKKFSISDLKNFGTH
jgi:hypothetical protein